MAKKSDPFAAPSDLFAVKSDLSSMQPYPFAVAGDL